MEAFGGEGAQDGATEPTTPGSGWGSMLDDSLRAATAPPKDERDSARRRSNGGTPASEAPAWLADSQDEEWSASSRAALKSAQGLGLHDLNASLRQKRVPVSECRQDRDHKQHMREKVGALVVHVGHGRLGERPRARRTNFSCRMI